MTGSSFEVERRRGGVSVLSATRPVSLLAGATASELRNLVQLEQRQGGARALVLDIDGAWFGAVDVALLDGLESVGDAEARAREAQLLTSVIETSKAPVVALVSGDCGGLAFELACACSKIVVAPEASLEFGLGRLGLPPALGTLLRLEENVGLEHALSLLLEDTPLTSEQACGLGFALDGGVAPKTQAAEQALTLRGPRSWLLRVRRRLRRQLLSERARRQLVDAQAPRAMALHEAGHLPRLLLELWRESGRCSREKALRQEAELFARCVLGSESRALRRTAVVEQHVWQELRQVEGTPTRIGVVGGGRIGAHVAALSSGTANLPVRLKERDNKGVMKGLRRVRAHLWGQGALSDTERRRRLARVTATTDYTGFQHADVLVESVSDDLTYKRLLLGELARAARSPAAGRTRVMLTTSVAWPVATVATERGPIEPSLLGLNYPMPLDECPVAELLVPVGAERSSVDLARRWLALQGKLPLVVRDGAGGFGFRLLVVLVLEALRLAEEGVRAERIDAALRAWGFRRGPLELLELYGAGVVLRAAQVLHDACGERFRPPATLQRAADDTLLRRVSAAVERVGRGSQPGWLVERMSRLPYLDLQRLQWLRAFGKTGEAVADEDIVERCVALLVDEALQCQESGVIDDVRQADLGTVLGLGFPRFRGGPFAHLDEVGGASLLTTLDRLRAQHGERFRPSRALLAVGAATRPAPSRMVS